MVSMSLKEKRKICFIITSKIHYSRSKLLIKELSNENNIELQLVVGASAILPQYGDVLSEMEKDGFKYQAKVTMTLDGGSSVSMAKTAGLGVIEFASVFENLKPDLVVVRGDRYEVLSATIAAAYLNITVAHNEGGDISGTIDESVRHAITKLAHIHFVTNEDAKKRILRMGENPNYVFNFGCPGIEMLAVNNYEVSEELINRLGVGDIIDINKNFIVVMQHPVTTEIDRNREYANETLEAVVNLNIPTIWFWPNVDAGTDEVSKAIRVFRENRNPKNIRFIKYLPTDQFLGLIKKATCLVGNSSAGIKESSFLGTPAVNIGTRQASRMRADNVIDVDYNQADIIQAVKKQIEHGIYDSSHIYYQSKTAKNIVQKLVNLDLYVQKKFFYN